MRTTIRCYVTIWCCRSLCGLIRCLLRSLRPFLLLRLLILLILLLFLLLLLRRSLCVLFLLIKPMKTNEKQSEVVKALWPSCLDEGRVF